MGKVIKFPSRNKKTVNFDDLFASVIRKNTYLKEQIEKPFDEKLNDINVRLERIKKIMAIIEYENQSSKK